MVPEVNGKVQNVFVDVGDHVQRGQLLVRLDTTLVAKQRIQAEHGVLGARAGLNSAVKGATLTDRQTAAQVRQAEQGVAAAREQLRRPGGHRLTADQTETAISRRGGCRPLGPSNAIPTPGRGLRSRAAEAAVRSAGLLWTWHHQLQALQEPVRPGP